MSQMYRNQWGSLAAAYNLLIFTTKAHKNLWENPHQYYKSRVLHLNMQ